MPDDHRRVELIGDRQGPQLEAGRAGLGLLIGLVAGHRSLLGAASGRLAFEPALAYFVLSVLASVGGTIALGILYDRFSRKQRMTDALDGAAATSESPDEDAYEDAMGNPMGPAENRSSAVGSE